jgi:hypothetical protein
MSKRYDLVGQKFGRLTVISKGDVVKQKTTWHCKCECGNDVVTTTGRLNAGLVQSCGCMWKDNARKIGKARFIDHTGQKFERLTVIRLIKKAKSYTLWECECECGKLTEVRGNDLRTGNTRSCGCLNVDAMREEGEKHKDKILANMVENTNLGKIDSKIPKNNKSGVKGVSWNTRRQKWEAKIMFQGKRYNLGAFDSVEEAANVRKEAEERLFHPILKKYGKDPK